MTERNEGTERFVQLEVRVITGTASASDLIRYRQIRRAARGEEGGLIPLLRKAIIEDRGVIESFPSLLALGATEFDERLYEARLWGMQTLLGDLERLLIEALSE